MLPLFKAKKGFTLIELLVVIAILSILLVIVLVAINPARQTRDARNTQRRADVLTILNAVNQFFVDNGAFPSDMPAAGAPAEKIGDLTASEADICSDLVATYVAGMPFDPSASTAEYTDCTTYDADYEISVSTTDDRVTVAAPSAEGTTISVTR
ncbi:type II secretion system protein [Patescibacteria group bacterium]|nr:type II secretion system protein [Patescibacteria group bacterium]